MIPEREPRLAAHSASEHMGHPHRESGRAAGATHHGFFADTRREISHLGGRNGKAEGRHFGRHHFRRPGHINRKILPRLHRARRDERHNAHAHLRYHRAITDDPNV